MTKDALKKRLLAQRLPVYADRLQRLALDSAFSPERSIRVTAEHSEQNGRLMLKGTHLMTAHWGDQQTLPDGVVLRLLHALGDQGKDPS